MLPLVRVRFSQISKYFGQKTRIYFFDENLDPNLLSKIFAYLKGIHISVGNIEMVANWTNVFGSFLTQLFHSCITDIKKGAVAPRNAIILSYVRGIE